MAMIRITFDARLTGLAKDPPQDLADPVCHSHVLYDTWQNRRTIAWDTAAQPLPSSRHDHPTRFAATLSLDFTVTTDLPQSCAARLSIDVDLTDRENPIEKAKRLLDLPVAATPRRRLPADCQSLSAACLRTIKGSAVIGALPPQWPVGRHISAYSQYLGSYGQGGVGLSGWQLNGGSWMVLPIANSESWITLTMEETRPSDDRARLDITIDQRIIGVHPNGKHEFWPSEHRYCGHDPIADLPDFAHLRPRVSRFAASASGFVLETGGGGQIWRFEIADHLPRPRWGGTGQPRDLYEGEDIAEALLLAHDPYLDV
ncbi:hypothetical protein GG804_01895 [Sphingomonas histidinilytica]|uniref:hypothetical protein n=1 Tax=Rhizorhabdus histidinilytica TaxID=439228 RepID=UPI001AD9D505|nr:hypothetical protein [Rhizorhabdus histidinilytica]MBO9375510.1 hypothetical protein [Rhizorhabdus histidinilytica]